ncbi:glycoside hydrolase family 2 TIM barrel-domain containing protein [Persicobacter diffluens]|uniref:Beta-galactosidase n=1 Tax=Persicobacter diffluens TaxID=981 RepID=A0AAN4W1X4_9BACT|nr:beta-galactosidase [Persicobacter diffluens]
MNNFFKIYLAVLIMSCLSCQTVPPGTINFNKDWKFLLVQEDKNNEEEFHLPILDDTQWSSVALPHSAHLEPLLVNDQWQGTCWYRKHYFVPAGLGDHKVLFELEAAMATADIWVNGTKVDHHEGGYLPVVVDITPQIKAGQNNVIAIRLDNRDNPFTGPKPLKILDFNMYGGLYRNAYLHIKNATHISHPAIAEETAGGGIFISFPKVQKEEAEVQIKTHIVNESTKPKEVKLQYIFKYKDEIVKEFTTDSRLIEAGHHFSFKNSHVVAAPKLWSPKTPHLYTLETTLLTDGEEVEHQSQNFGIRNFEFKGLDLYINGEKSYLRGVNRHQEYPFIGYALSDNAQYRDAKKIKEAGFDMIRLSHYPQSPAFMKACDELGLVVIDAILGWQYYLDDDKFRAFCYNSARQLIRRDRNHPSVLAWEVSLNETKMPIPFMEELDKIVHEEYPGENVYSCGWMDDVYDIFLQARQHRILHPHENHTKPYFVSEYGDWEYYSKNPGLNQHQHARSKRIELSSRQARKDGEERLLNQAKNLQEAYNDNLSTVAFGDGYWVMYDYNRGYHKDLEHSGIMDIFRLPKYSYYFYASQRAPEQGSPMVHIASEWSPYSPREVKVYGNVEEVAFYLNGKLLFRQKADNNNNTSRLPFPPFTFETAAFEAGVIKAEGFINGQLVAEHSVRTAEKAERLKIWWDESGKAPEAGCNDVIFVYIAATDANGTIDPTFTGEIQLDLEGEALIMNTESLQAEAGIATALIKIGDQAGNLLLNAQHPELSPAALQIAIQAPLAQ